MLLARVGPLRAIGFPLYLLLLIAARSSHADVVLVDDLRRISYDFGSGITNVYPSAPFVAFNASGFGLSYQNSTVSTAAMSAIGNGSYTEGDPTETGSSRFDIVFDVTSNAQITIDGSLDILGGDGAGTASVRLRRVSPSSVIYEWGLDGPFSHASVLAPGQYRIEAIAGGSVAVPNSDAAYDVQVALAPALPMLGPLATGLLMVVLGASGGGVAVASTRARRHGSLEASRGSESAPDRWRSSRA